MTEQENLDPSAQQPDDEPQTTNQQPQTTAPAGGQLKLSVNELKRLATRIVQDFDNDLSDHRKRMNRFLRYYRMWRDRVGMSGGEAGASNFHVPLVKWQLFARWAKEVDALLGDDAEIVANPTAPTDAGRVRKVGRYMTWRVFNSMKATTPIIIFLFFKLLFGRAFAYAPYKKETYDVPGQGEVVNFDGPGFDPIWPDNILVPAEDVQSVQDFSHVFRRFRATPDELLDGEGTLYQGITENWEKIYQASLNTYQRNSQTDQMTREQDEAEGVLRDFSQSAGESLEVWEWYGRHRMLKGKADGTIDNWKRREMRETELVIRYLPDCDLIIGAQDLADLYPKMKNRRPIVESSLVKDGSYWGPSFPELLEDIEIEMNVNHNIATEAGERSVGPLILYRPGTGVNPKVLRWEPNLMIPVDNPQEDVKVITLNPNLQFSTLRQQELLDYSERVSGVTEANLGRQSDRPNQPRTLGQTQIFQGESSVRLSLDHRVVREDFGDICEHIWNLDSMYAAPELFFRVTEEQANGLFETKDGFGTMSANERNARFDFDLKFATSTHSKESQKAEKAQIFQAMMVVPLVQQNPVAQWLIMDDFLKAFGHGGMGKYMAKPGPTDFPKDPSEEWSLMLEGEDVQPNAMDDDQIHMAGHQKQLQQEQQKKDEYRDTDAEHRLIAHILATQQQIQQKQLQAETAQAMGGALAGLAAGGAAGGGAAGQQQGGAAPAGGGQPGGGLDLGSLIQSAMLQHGGVGGG